MTHAYSADALCYDGDTDSYALRPDYEPGLHRVVIEGGGTLGWPSDVDAGWNDPDDPPVAQVRDMLGLVINAGHACVTDRFRLICPDGAAMRVDALEIDHDPIGFIAEGMLEPGVSYPVAQIAQPYCAKVEVAQTTGYGPGTVISTLEGDLPVEWLAAGDRVLTLGNGPKPLRWIGYTRLSARDLAADARLHPVRLTPDIPYLDGLTHDLELAAQTHVLLSGPQIALNFGLDQSMGRACDLADQRPPARHVPGLTYFLLLFDDHQTVRANGLWCESLYADRRKWPDLVQRHPTAPSHISHDRYTLPCLQDWETALVRQLHHDVRILRRTKAA